MAVVPCPSYVRFSFSRWCIFPPLLKNRPRFLFNSIGNLSNPTEFLFLISHTAFLLKRLPLFHTHVPTLESQNSCGASFCSAFFFLDDCPCFSFRLTYLPPRYVPPPCSFIWDPVVAPGLFYPVETFFPPPRYSEVSISSSLLLLYHHFLVLETVRVCYSP